MYQEQDLEAIRFAANRAEPLYYLSFAGDTGFLGAAIVSGPGPQLAVQRAIERGLKPETCDEVAVVAIPRGLPAPPVEAIDRFLSLLDVELLLGACSRLDSVDLAAMSC